MSLLMLAAVSPLELTYFALVTLLPFHTSGDTQCPMVGKKRFLNMMTDIFIGHSPALLGWVSR